MREEKQTRRNNEEQKPDKEREMWEDREQERNPSLVRRAVRPLVWFRRVV